MSDAVARSAAGSAHVLVVEVPGWWPVRAAVERAALSRGWRLAVSPADADVLVVCGDPGPQLAEAAELVWHQMPGPRVRVEVRERDEVVARLDDARALLLDTRRHRNDAHGRLAASNLRTERTDGEHSAMDHSGMEHSEHGGMDHGDADHGEHGGMDHRDADHGGHGGMDHGDMEMAPGGIPLAGGGEDRDGLEMDVLNVRLGPVLPSWPAGLVLRCSLQGDVISKAGVELVDGASHLPASGDPRARTVDSIASLLALSGWDAASAQARRVRDALLEDGGGEGGTTGLDDLRRKVRRSRLLRWSLRGVAPLTDDDVREHALPAESAGDTHDRLLRMLDRAGDARDQHAPTYTAHHLERLVTGLDLATARLAVASLDAHSVRAGHAEHEVAHG